MLYGFYTLGECISLFIYDLHIFICAMLQFKMFKALSYSEGKIYRSELNWDDSLEKGKKSNQSCGRQLLGLYFLSGLPSLTNSKVKISEVNSLLASMASTNPTPWVSPIQNTGLWRVNSPVGTIHQVLITIAACSEFSGNRTRQSRFHPNPRWTFPPETRPCHIRHDKTSKQ